jgi:hypothetical protein
MTALDERADAISEGFDPGRRDELMRLAFETGAAIGYQRGLRDAEADQAELFARLRDHVLESASPRSQAYAARREAELRRAREGSQLTGPELIERARQSMRHYPTRPDPPAGLHPLTWDGTWKPKRPDAIWTADQERTHRMHARKADAA